MSKLLFSQIQRNHYENSALYLAKAGFKNQSTQQDPGQDPWNIKLEFLLIHTSVNSAMNSTNPAVQSFFSVENYFG